MTEQRIVVGRVPITVRVADHGDARSTRGSAAAAATAIQARARSRIQESRLERASGRDRCDPRACVAMRGYSFTVVGRLYVH